MIEPDVPDELDLIERLRVWVRERRLERVCGVAAVLMKSESTKRKGQERIQCLLLVELDNYYLGRREAGGEREKMSSMPSLACERKHARGMDSSVFSRRP